MYRIASECLRTTTPVTTRHRLQVTSMPPRPGGIQMRGPQIEDWKWRSALSKEVWSGGEMRSADFANPDLSAEAQSTARERSFTALERSFTALERSFSALERSFTAVERSFTALERSFRTTVPSPPSTEDDLRLPWHEGSCRGTLFVGVTGLVRERATA